MGSCVEVLRVRCLSFISSPPPHVPKIVTIELRRTVVQSTGPQPLPRGELTVDVLEGRAFELWGGGGGGHDKGEEEVLHFGGEREGVKEKKTVLAKICSSTSSVEAVWLDDTIVGTASWLPYG